MTNVLDILFGRKDKAKQFQTTNPQQNQLLQMIFQALSGGGGQTGPFQNLFGEFNPEQTADVFQRGVAEPAMRNFNQRIVPGIMENFADQAYHSGLGNSLATAGRDLSENLASQGSLFNYNAMMQQRQNQLGGINSVLGTQTFQPYVQQGYAGVVPDFLRNFAGGAGKAFGYGFGGY